MGLPFHTVYTADGLGVNVADRIYAGSVTVTYASTSGTATATVAVSWSEPVPTPYVALPTMVEKANAWITSPTALGFTFNIAGLASLSGGTVEVLIFS